MDTYHFDDILDFIMSNNDGSSLFGDDENMMLDLGTEQLGSDDRNQDSQRLSPDSTDQMAALNFDDIYQLMNSNDNQNSSVGDENMRFDLETESVATDDGNENAQEIAPSSGDQMADLSFELILMNPDNIVIPLLEGNDNVLIDVATGQVVTIEYQNSDSKPEAPPTGDQLVAVAAQTQNNHSISTNAWMSSSSSALNALTAPEANQASYSTQTTKKSKAPRKPKAKRVPLHLENPDDSKHSEKMKKSIKKAKKCFAQRNKAKQIMEGLKSHNIYLLNELTNCKKHIVDLKKVIADQQKQLATLRRKVSSK